MSVSVLLQTHTYAKFIMRYEELLERKLGVYEHVVHPRPPPGTEKVT